MRCSRVAPHLQDRWHHHFLFSVGWACSLFLTHLLIVFSLLIVVSLLAVFALWDCLGSSYLGLDLLLVFGSLYFSDSLDREVHGANGGDSIR